MIPKAPSNNPNACEFDINYYPKVVRRRGEKTSRKLVLATVQFDTEAVFKDNLVQAVEWKKAINLQSQKAVRKIFQYSDTNTLECTLLWMFVFICVLHG